MAGPPNIPLTWRNVSAPDGSGALNAFNRAGESLGQAFEGLGSAVKQGAQDYADYETQEFLTDLNAEQDPAKRQQMIAASQAFLDHAQVNEAQKANLIEDRARAGEERSVAKHADDLLTTASQRLTAKTDRDIAIAEELERKTNEDIVRKNLQQDLKEGAADIRQSDAAAAASQALTTGRNQANAAVQKQLDDVAIVGKQLESIQDLEPGSPAYNARVNELIQENKIKGVKDPDKRLIAEASKALEATPVSIGDRTFVAAGLTGSDRDYSTKSYKKLHKAIVTQLRETHPHASTEALNTKAESAIDASEHGLRFSDQQKYEAKTPQERAVIDQQRQMDEYTSQLVNARGTGEFTNVLATATEYALKNGVTPAQRDRLVPFMEMSLANLDLKSEETFLASVGKTATTAVPSDYGPGQKKEYINAERTRLKKKYPYAADAVIDAKITQSINRAGNLATKFASGAAPAEVSAELDKAAAETVLNTAKKRNQAIVDMGENPTKHILGILTTKFASQGRSDNVDPKKLSRVVETAIEKWRGYFSNSSLSTQANNALNLAIRDTLSNIEVDIDRADVNDYALPGVNDSEDAHNISKREALAKLLKHLPKKSDNLHPGVLDKAIKKIMDATPERDLGPQLD